MPLIPAAIGSEQCSCCSPDAAAVAFTTSAWPPPHSHPPPPQGQEPQRVISYVFSCQCLSRANFHQEQLAGEPWEMQGSPSLRYICSQNAIQRIHGTATGKLAFPSTKPTQCPCTQGPLPRLLALSRSRELLTCHRGCKYEETRAENGVGVILAWRLGAHHAFFIHREIFDLPLTRTHS